VPVAWSIRSARDIIFALGTWVLDAPGVVRCGAKIGEACLRIDANRDYCGEFDTATRLLNLLKMHASESNHFTPQSTPRRSGPILDWMSRACRAGRGAKSICERCVDPGLPNSLNLTLPAVRLAGTVGASRHVAPIDGGGQASMRGGWRPRRAQARGHQSQGSSRRLDICETPDAATS
jgi:hypothetical protein